MKKPGKRPELPPEWVDKIFEKLARVYGVEFLNRWRGMPLEDVKADWGLELGGFLDWPEAIAYGLQHLPADRAPTVLQFRDLCRKAPRPDVPQLEGPRPDPQRVRAELAPLIERLKVDENERAPKAGKGWALSIQERAAKGERVSAAALRLARSVIRGAA